MNFNPYFGLHGCVFGNMWTCVNNNVGDMCWNSMWHPININLDSNPAHDFVKYKVLICSNSIMTSSDKKLISYEF